MRREVGGGRWEVEGGREAGWICDYLIQGGFNNNNHKLIIPTDLPSMSSG